MTGPTWDDLRDQELPADQEDLILRYGIGTPGADPCPVPGCPISAQEHHRLTRGRRERIRFLDRRVQQLEQLLKVNGVDVPPAEVSR